MKHFIKGSITTSLHKTYDIGNQLGTGKFSVVKSATERNTGKPWAMKIMKKSVVHEQNLIREVEIMQDIKHKNIISLHEIYETEGDVVLVLELVTGGELFDKIVERNSYTEEDAAKLVNTLTRVIHYIHSKDIVHCDLKPENLLYSDNSDSAIIKLCDFGLSQRCTHGEKLRSLVGTATFMAPEIMTGNGYSKEVDMWSLGVIIYILLCGFPPFDETTGYNLEFPSPEWDNISESAKGLIRSLLTVDPSKRPVAAQALKHVWVTGESCSKQSIIGTLKTLREFNTLRRAGTTMGHNKSASRSTVFELFPSLSSATIGKSSTSSFRPPLPSRLSQHHIEFTKSNSCFLDDRSAQSRDRFNLELNFNSEAFAAALMSRESKEEQAGGHSNNSSSRSDISNSTNSSSSSLLKELDQETTEFQSTLRRSLMSYSQEEKDDALNEMAPEIQAGDVSVLEKERLRLLEQLRREREVNAKLMRELDEARKKAGERPASTAATTSSLMINGSHIYLNGANNDGVASPSLVSSSETSSSSSSSSSLNNKKDKSKNGVDRIVHDLQQEFDRIGLSKDVNERLNTVMTLYRIKNQDKSLRVQLDKKREKCKRLKAQLLLSGSNPKTKSSITVSK
ncbi:hypothetical protein SAMD00019534_002620 [Acytostelium subglobosum LB1]|uniref:hypothetical protein n=1 Tax=Acytostelium subglobosum LB1 TaxID=1410327 RepID=UPI0006448EAF|nr:hypothetical protein SAMD00019534_002620 [Acytostelium subglobosum LB1]GAM17088.1 hypothetical protein SAMD00019534_002620 [Acytostelium subglobosum LB1]|eukprot:XP_012759150.1 hypothetical protein SAMD00019534_002620 [Acytostelium subglobosum LB1]